MSLSSLLIGVIMNLSLLCIALSLALLWFVLVYVRINCLGREENGSISSTVRLDGNKITYFTVTDG